MGIFRRHRRADQRPILHRIGRLFVIAAVLGAGLPMAECGPMDGSEPDAVHHAAGGQAVEADSHSGMADIAVDHADAHHDGQGNDPFDCMSDGSCATPAVLAPPAAALRAYPAREQVARHPHMRTPTHLQDAQRPPPKSV